ncbi:hypothetical protein MAR_034233 [Mya arenaria]|uniref:Uncharacterized protein n=1 Tax=Mya arenaria TaxID=6604 RepID=A0ABY7GJP8_MYAAR|nr:hypothetical protein MAR_034233 [Mya arenaria]
MTSLKDKVVIITGRVKSKLDVVEESLLATGLKQDRLLVVLCDVTDDAQLQNLVQRTLQIFGQIDSSDDPDGALCEKWYERGEIPPEDQKQKHVLGRVGEPDEVAKAITFLASDQASFTSGQILYVGDGRHKKPII